MRGNNSKCKWLSLTYLALMIIKQMKQSRYCILAWSTKYSDKLCTGV